MSLELWLERLEQTTFHSYVIELLFTVNTMSYEFKQVLSVTIDNDLKTCFLLLSKWLDTAIWLDDDVYVYF